MTQFHAGQEVEVSIPFTGKKHPTVGRVEIWRKAKIVTVSQPGLESVGVCVIFPDGTHGVFDEDYIRSAQS